MNIVFFNGFSFFHYTGPEKPENVIVTERGTRNLNISWSSADSERVRFVVNISNEDLGYAVSNEATVSNMVCANLFPGRIFNVIVSAVAGNFTNTSDPFQLATCKSRLCAAIVFMVFD